jgi:TrmH family RNA methyltransferase
MQRVTSRQNPRLKDAVRLIASARDRRKAGRCVLEGEHTVGVYWERFGAPETLIVTEDALAGAEAVALAQRAPGRTLVVPTSLFAELAAIPVGVGMLAVVPTPPPADTPPADFCLLVDDVQDPGNVGSMLRSAAAAGARQVLLSKHCAFAWSPKVLRAGQGAHFLLDIREDVDLVQWAAEYASHGGRVVATTLGAAGSDLYATSLRGRVAVAIGNEGAGLSPALAAVATDRVTIPMPGGMESLNAAAAAAVCLFEAVRQRRA